MRIKWFKPPAKYPPLHCSVLIKLKESIGDVYDVACFIGKSPDGLDRWILGDIHLNSKQIAEWTWIIQPHYEDWISAFQEWQDGID